MQFPTGDERMLSASLHPTPQFLNGKQPIKEPIEEPLKESIKSPQSRLGLQGLVLSWSRCDVGGEGHVSCRSPEVPRLCFGIFLWWLRGIELVGLWDLTRNKTRKLP